MSLRLEMLQAAMSARTLLHEAGDRVVAFLKSQMDENGAGKDRSGESDLYYTVFAVEGLIAMGVDPPVASILQYLRGFGDGKELDLVHRACLARCWANMPAGSLGVDVGRRILQHIESHRSADGGYGPGQGDATGTAYHSLLALGAYQDLQSELPNPEGLEHCLAGLRTHDGAYANQHGMRFGTTPATAAAATALGQLDIPVPPSVGTWLMARCQDAGGFLAAPNTPFPDLLSTATALHALTVMGVSLENVRHRCLTFLDSLWTGRAFRGHPIDDVEDCEYTYYALLALGHLSS